MNTNSKKRHKNFIDNSTNKQNIGVKIPKSKQYFEKAYKHAQSSSYSRNVVGRTSEKQKLHKWNSSSRVMLVKCQNTSQLKQDILARNASKKNFECSRQVKILKQIVKFPKINKEQNSSSKFEFKKRSGSVKKILTEPCQQHRDNQFLTATLSPKESMNMKQMLVGIVKSKQNRHLINIDEQIDKLQILTKRYSCLRKDLTCIQQDILTINLKQKYKQCRQYNRDDSQTVSSVYM